MKTKKAVIKSPNAHIWEANGIGVLAHRQCDKAMALMLEAVRIAGPQADPVYHEALFQIRVLPTLKQTKVVRKSKWKAP